MKKLTRSQENYLECIYRLAEKGPVRIKDLADRMDVKLPSVSRAVKGLAENGLVNHKSYSDIELTAEGRRVGQIIVRRDECLTKLLVGILGMSPTDAYPEVHRLEHVLGGEVLRRLEVLVEFALSSEAWMKRLRYRIRININEIGQDVPFRIGETSVHGGHEMEKDD